MGVNRLKKSAKGGLISGVILLAFGILLFMNFESESKPEKLGVVLMMYGGLLIGMAYTAFVALQTK